MRLTFHGAAQTVTGSMHLLEVNGSKLLLECGLFQGARSETYARNQNFPFDPKEIDAVLLSHAHIDHSGNLPLLVKQGYTGPIYATQATVHLADLMLRDAGHVQESIARNLSFHRTEKGLPPVEPLYTEEDGAAVKDYLHPVSYGKTFEPIPGVAARYEDAGHILGSAGIRLDLEEKRRKVSLWFSGDIGRRDLPLLRDPVLPEKVDYLLMESTYGDKPHRTPQQASDELREVITRTLKRGGKVVIPAFAVGRTQALVYNFNMMYEANGLPRVPIYVDSPLAVNASDIFKEHAECFDAETHAYIRQHRHPALDFEQLTYIRSLDESKALNQRKDPMVIISASGMAETGRIVYHIRYCIEDPRSTILIVSWQAPNTLGRRLAERERHVRILGESFHRRADIATIGGFSAHAGQDFLLEYALAAKASLKQLFLVHGEAKPAAALREALRERGISQVFYPERATSVEL